MRLRRGACGEAHALEERNQAMYERWYGMGHAIGSAASVGYVWSGHSSVVLLTRGGDE